jgi:hypothetical protein
MPINKKPSKRIINKKPLPGLKWFNNVAKSLGYSSQDLVREMFPATVDFTSSNSDTVKEITSNMRSTKTILSKIQSAIINNDQIKIAKTGMQNAIKDLKSGNIYNKKRFDEMIEKEFEDFDMSDLNLNEEEKATHTINNIRPTIINNEPILKALEKQSEVISHATDATIKTTVAVASQQMMFDTKLFNMLGGGVDSINRNLSSLVTFQSESMTKYVGASLKYYEESLKVMTSQVTELKKMTAGITEQQQARKYENPMNEAFGAYGGLNLKGYFNQIKKNFGTAVDQDLITSNLKMMLQDKESMKYFAANPLMFLSNRIAAMFLPSLLKQTFTSFDKTFSAFFPALMAKVNRLVTESGDNPLFNFLGTAFGINIKSKTSADLSKYNRGQIPFDGETKAAITEVIPTYLRKILATLSGQEEMGFDYTNRKFKSIHAMTTEFKEARTREVTGKYSEASNFIQGVVRKGVKFNTQEAEDTFNKNLTNFFMQLTEKGAQINPFKKSTRGGDIVDELGDLGLDRGTTKLLKEVFNKMPNNILFNLFGKSMFEARSASKKFFEKIEENPLMYGYSTLESFKNYDQHIERAKGNTNKYRANKKMMGAGYDDAGYAQLDYLRSIETILAHGIIVYPSSGEYIAPVLPPHAPHITKVISDIKKRSEKIDAAKTKFEEENTKPRYSERAQLRIARKGQILAEDTYDLVRMSPEQIGQIIQEMQEEEDSKKGNLLTWAGQFFRGKPQERYNLIKEKVEDFLSVPIKLLKNVFDKVDNTMFKIIFGEDKEGSKVEHSFLGKVLRDIKKNVGDAFSSLKKTFFIPIRDALIGEKGFLTKLENSEFFKSFLNKTKGFFGQMFGTFNATSNRLEGGIFGEAGNELRGMWSSFKHYFDGKSYKNAKGETVPDESEKSVFGEVRKIFKGFGSNVKKYFFGDKQGKDDQDKKGIFGSIGDTLTEGFMTFYDLIFGHRKMSAAKDKIMGFKEYTSVLKQRAPKALAWGAVGGGAGLAFGGSLGLLGSIFLPGGPIGGAIVGTFLGFLAQSDKFKNWLLGDKDPNTNERLGGFIGKKTQDFLRKNKVGIIGGATVGALKSVLGFGLLPGMFLPGGPIGGAILGAGVSVAVRSEKFKEFLFGKEDKLTGEKTGGILTKLFGKFKTKDGKSKLAPIAAGALGGGTLGLITSQFGLLGGMMLGGPLGGAILGATTGFLISSEKWKKKLFGEVDEDTGLRKGGLFEKLINYTNLQILKPIRLKFKEMRLNMGEWFEKSIKNPFLDAIEPMKQMFKEVVDNMKNMFKAGWDNFKDFLGTTFEKFVGAPFGKFMEEKVMKPLKSFLSKIIGGVGKIFGSILKAPIQILSAITGGYESSTEARAESTWKKGKKFSKQGGILYAIKARLLGKYNTTDAAELAAKKAEALPYKAERDKAKAERIARTNRKYALLHQRLANERGSLVNLQNQYISNDYIGNEPITTESIIGGALPVPVPEARSVIHLGPGGTTNAEIPEDLENQPVTRVQDTIERTARQRRLRARAGQTEPVGGGAEPAIPTEENIAAEQGIPKARTSGKGKATAAKGRATGPIDSKIIYKISKNIQIIADAVKGNLNGVGYNVNVIKNILKKAYGGVGVQDEDFTNKKYETLFQKVKNFFTKPFKFIGDKIQGLVTGVTDRIRSAVATVADIIKKVGTGIKDVVIGTINGIKWVGKTLITSMATIIKIPYELAKTVASLAQGAVETLKLVGPAIGEGLKGVAAIFSGFAYGVKETLKGFSVGVYEVLKGFGKGFGDILSGIGSLIGGSFKFLAGVVSAAGPKIVSFVEKTVTLAVDTTIKAISFMAKKVIEVGKTLLDIVTSPFKFVGNLLGKLGGGTKKVEIAGGTIDVVKLVEKIGKGSNAKEDELSRLSRLKSEGRGIGKNEVPVRIVGSDRPIPVFFYMGHNQLQGGAARGVGAAAFVRGGEFTPKADNIDVTGSFFNMHPYKALPAGQNAPLLLESAEMKAKAAREKGSATAILTREKMEEEKAKAAGQENEQTKSLKEIAATTKEQHSSWTSIFGKKGLITLAIVAGLYALVKFIQDPSKFLETMKTKLIEFAPALGAVMGVALLPTLARVTMGLVAKSVLTITGSLLKGLGGLLVKGFGLLKGLILGKDVAAAATATTATTAGAAAAGGGGAVVGGAALEREVAAGSRAVAKTGILGKIGKIAGKLKGKGGLIAGGVILGSMILPSIFSKKENAAPITSAAVPDISMADVNAMTGIDTLDDTGITQTQTATPAVQQPTEQTPGLGSQIADFGIQSANISARIAGKKAVTATIKGKLGLVTTEATRAAESDKGNILKSITKFFEKMFGPDSTIGKKLVGFLGSREASEGVLSKFSKLILGKLKTILASNKILRYIPKLIEGLGETATKVATGAATLGIVTAAFAIWDGITGAIDAAHLFMVDPVAVDTKMRISSAIIKIIFGFLPIFDIFVEIGGAIIGVNFKQWIATTLYKLLSSQKEGVKLDAAIAKFQSEAEQAGMTSEEFNEKRNVTVEGKIGKGFGAAYKGLEQAGREIYKFQEKVIAGGKNIIKGAGNVIGGVTKKAGDIVSDMIGDTAVRKRLGLFEGSKVSMAERAISAGSVIAEKLSFGVLKAKNIAPLIEGAKSKIENSITDTVKEVQEGYKKLKENAKDAWKGIKKGVGEALTDANNAIGNFFGFKDKKGKPVSFTKGMGNSFDTGVKALQYNFNEAVDTVKGGAKFVADKASDMWGSVKDSVGTALTDTNNAIGKLFGFKNAEGKTVSFTDGIGTALTDAASTVGNVMSDIGKTVSDFWSGFKTDIGKKFKDFTEAVPKSLNAVDKSIGSFLGLKDDKGDPITLTQSVTSFFTGVKKSAKFETAINQAQRAKSEGKNAKYIIDQLKKQGYTGIEMTNILADAGVFNGGKGGYTSNGGFGNEKINNFVYYSQSDPKWNTTTYDWSKGGHADHPTIGYRGCGPTSMAMVVSQLTGKQYEPPILAKMAQDEGYSISEGTDWGYFPRVGKQFGLNVYDVGTDLNAGASKFLNAGFPLILSGKKDPSSSTTQSPFTAGGHFVVATGIQDGKILINDPRSADKSKPYDVSIVSKEFKNAWGFTPTGVSPSNMPSAPLVTNTATTGTDQTTDTSIFGQMAAATSKFETANPFTQGVTDLGTTFDDLVKRMFGATPASDVAGATPATSGSSFNVSADWSSLGLTNDKKFLDAVLNKTIEMSVKGESSGNYALAKNDVNAATGQPISPSIGIMQWRGYHAKNIFSNIAKMLPNDTDAQYYAKFNWEDNKPWSEAEQKKLSDFLKKNYAVAKKVQDDYMVQHVRNNNMAPVLKNGYMTGKLKDPRALVFLSDFANTGPAYASSFLKSYTPYSTASGEKNEFDHFYNEFKAKSFWGQKSGLYKGRYTELYNTLANWTPGAGGFGNGTLSVGTKNSFNFSDKKLSENLKTMNNGKINSKLSDELLQKAVDVLTQISSNTDMTSSGIGDLAKKGIKINITSNGTTSTNTETGGFGNVTNVVMGQPGANRTSLYNNLSDSVDENNLRGYNQASTIAKGRIY